jgi:AcrR family transcriptional regulator
MPAELDSQRIRDLLIARTIEELRVNGPASIRPARICLSLGLRPSAVNYHFGSREGLIRAAVVAAYQSYSVEFVEIHQREASAKSRLLAHLQHQVNWSVANPALVNMLNGSSLASFDLDQQYQINLVLERNLSLLGIAIQDFIDKKISQGESAIPEFRNRKDVQLATAMVAHVVHGYATWLGGPLLQRANDPVIKSASDLSQLHFESLVLTLIQNCVNAVRAETTAS